MATRSQRSERGNYQGLESFRGDARQWQYLKLLDDRLSRCESRLDTLTTRVAALEARPILTTDQVQAYVQQQIAAFAASAIPPAAVPGVPGDTNTIPSDALPLFDGSAIVQGVFAANPAMVATSCQSAPGGTWDLMDAIVDALRAADTRFAYNGKRGDASNPSFDAISYDYGAVPGGEGTTTVYVVDVISGHCGPNPQPGWNDVTVFAPGVWISRGRF